MANPADTIISTSAMLGACLASVRAALVQTRTVLRDGTPKGTDVGTLSTRVDTLEAFYEPSFSAALSRRRDVFGPHGGGRDNG